MTREQSSKEQVYRFDIEHIHLVNNRRDRSPIVANRNGLFQVTASMSCDSFGVANSLEARFVNALAQWEPVSEILGVNTALMNTVGL